jgi:lipoyl(octanoyl) transferase
VGKVDCDLFFLLESGAGGFAFNMALDEALLEWVSYLGRPVLRFYSWTEAVASFGYFQKVALIEQLTALRPLVRRPTGGGLVPHDADWTYSVIIPPAHPWYGLRAESSYERVHRWLQGAFTDLGATATLAPCARQEMPGQCFSGYEKHDLLWLGRKIAGAAQRRTRAGLLIQGSVQPPPAVRDRALWQRAMCGFATRAWAVGWVPLVLPSDLAERAACLARDKYSQDAHNRRR